MGRDDCDPGSENESPRIRLSLKQFLCSHFLPIVVKNLLSECGLGQDKLETNQSVSALANILTVGTSRLGGSGLQFSPVIVSPATLPPVDLTEKEEADKRQYHQQSTQTS